MKMKVWKNAELLELNINETAEGGRNLEKVDGIYTDSITGNFYASFASGVSKTENEGDGEITVIK